MNNRFDYAILEAINNAVRTVKASPLMLGGVAGSGGGIGGPAGGFAGYLPQTRVAYDLSEVESSGLPESGWSLLDNLNHIRYRLGVVESGASIVVFDDNTLASYLDTTAIHFSGAGVSVVDLGGGSVKAVITATGSGGSSNFLDLTDTPVSYSGSAGKSVVVNPTEDGLIFTTISGGGSGSPIDVYDDSIPVASGISILDFGDNLGVYDLGSGHVLISGSTSLDIENGIVNRWLEEDTTIPSGHSLVLVEYINLDGFNLSIEGDGAIAIIDGATISGGSLGHIIQDEGVTLASRTYLNFVGSGVTVTDDSINDRTIVTISGVVSSGGAGTWGSITGTLSDQTDLQSALDLKADAADVKERLSADRTYYVRTDGSDSNTGLVDSAGGAFLTIQKALNTAALLESYIYNVTIQVGSGTYAASNVVRRMSGSGMITILGDETTPSNVHINPASGTCFTVSGVGNRVNIRGFKLSSVNGIYAQNYSYVTFANIEFSSIGIQIYALDFAKVTVTGNYSISASADYHIYCGQFSFGNISGATITFSNSPSFISFVTSTWQSILQGSSMTFTNGGTVTGKRYNVTANGIIYTNGGGANYFPGGVAGTTATQGQYL